MEANSGFQAALFKEKSKQNSILKSLPKNRRYLCQVQSISLVREHPIQRNVSEIEQAKKLQTPKKFGTSRVYLRSILETHW
jgi:hypothetical protein